MSVMTDHADHLMLSGVVRSCPDCAAERIFVTTDECRDDRFEFCCTTCGAALLIDPVFDYTLAATRAA